MNPDISFIPEEIIPQKLRYLANHTTEYTYIDIDKFSSNKLILETHMHLNILLLLICLKMDMMLELYKNY